jgi:hypothetical protein
MFELKYNLKRRTEKAAMALVWKLPKKFVMWCAIRVIANATTGKYSNQVVPDLTAMEALARWEPANG